ncbi:tetratricopeptide repeat protein [Alishewanella longhuensis]
MMKSVLFSLLLSLPANAAIPAEFQQLFDRAHYQQLLADIAAQPDARQDPDLMLLQVRTLIQQQFREEANTLLNELVTEHPEHSGILTQAALNKLALANSGSVFNARKRASDALELLHKAVLLEPTNFQAQQALISFYQTAPANAGGSKALAAERAELLSQIDSTQGVLAKVTIATNETRLSDALQLLEQQLSLNPNNTDLLLRKATLLVQQRAFLVAQETYMQALPLLTDPLQQQSTQFQIGRLAVFSGKHQVAGIAALENYLAFYQNSQQPRLHRAKLRLAQLYIHEGEVDKARVLYAEVARINSDEQDFLEARDDLARALGYIADPVP